ncbi:MAG: cation acetate symporter, partial [Propionibacteriaceae bacterium]
LVFFSPVVSGSPSSMLPNSDWAWFPLNNPGLVSIPIGFLCGVLGTLLSSDPGSVERYDELNVRSLTGAGAEKATSH